MPDPAAAPQTGGDPIDAALDRDRVARRAYELYLARGGSEDKALDDWLAAERECQSTGERHRDE